MAEEYPPHAARACTACKQKKLRCLMSNGPPWTCERCVEKDQKCVIPESRPRQRRKKVYESRIQKLEQNLERVMSLLPDRNPSPTLAPTDAESPQDSGAFGIPPEQFHPDTNSHDLPSIERAEIYVAEYKGQFARNFPYVVIPEEANFLSLQQTSPMLLLAILVTTSWKDRTEQEALNQTFLDKLSSKLILEGDRDLDLLKGLMVYLNWIHLHIAPNTQQVYRLMSIATSMAIDYGISRRPGKGSHQQLNVESTNEIPKGLFALDAEFWCLEARRAYLGCYHIATWYSIMTRKVSPLTYSDYLYTCAQSVIKDGNVPSDGDLIFHLEITREAEKVYTLFNYTEAQEPQYMSDEQIQIYLNAFSSKVQDWRSRLSYSFAEDPCQQVWSWLFEVFVREVGLSGISRSPDLSIFRLRVIVDTLVRTKNYFDVFLSIPLNRIPSLPSTHWALLGYSIILTVTMSLSIQTSEWNIETAHSIIALEYYLEAISVRVRDLSSQTSASITLKNWYGNLLMSWEEIKRCYLAALQQKQSQTNTPDSHLQNQSNKSLQQGDELDHQNPASTQAWIDPCQAPVSDNSFKPNAGFELFDFAANAGSWISQDFDFSWRGAAGL